MPPNRTDVYFHFELAPDDVANVARVGVAIAHDSYNGGSFARYYCGEDYSDNLNERELPSAKVIFVFLFYFYFLFLFYFCKCFYR